MINAPASPIVHRLSILEIQKEKLGPSLFFSVLTHVSLIFAVFFIPAIMGGRSKPWGEQTGGGGAISVGMVRNLHGLNLPRPELTTQTNIATESKGAGVTEPAKVEKKEIEVPDPKAFQIEERKRKKKQKSLPHEKPRLKSQRLNPLRMWFPSGKEVLPTSAMRSFRDPEERAALALAAGYTANAMAGMFAR